MIEKFSNKVNESTSQKIKLGLDIHGVLDALPEFFSFLTDSFIKNNAEVHIITGGSWKNVEESLKKLNISYTHSFSVYDHLLKNAETIGDVEFPDGTVQKRFNDDVWDKCKSDYCREHNITLHIDDTLAYNEFFTTPFCRLWTHNNKPKVSHKSFRHLD